MSKEIAEEYASSLADLTVNSKPLINMLTILAEENIDHAGVIVDTVEKHLEKVHPEIKLPVLYLVDSIIKNVGGAYTQKFSQIIVNMFTRTFKQVDEKIRSQMFKLRETWHDVFPATKLYQLDVKVNLIDPAWPIQAQPIPAQPQQSNIHVNPTFLKKPVATTSAPTTSSKVEDDMLSILAKKEQELLMLQQKKIEMELEQTRRQLEMAERNVKKSPAGQASPSLAVTIVNPAAAATTQPAITQPATTQPATEAPLSAKQRLGPPVNRVTSGARIAPVSGLLAGARRDPRLSRTRAPVPAVTHPTAVPLVPSVTMTPTLPMPPTVPPPPIASNVFDIKPLDRVTKRKNVITIDVNPETNVPRDPRRRDPRLDKRNDDRPRRERVRDKKRDDRDKKIELEKNAVDKYINKFTDPKRINKLPPIPKINRDEPKDKETSPVKKKKDKDLRNDKRKKRERDVASDSKDNPGSSPEKKVKLKEVNRKLKAKEEHLEPDTEKPAENEVVAFKELKNYNKERYMRRNKEKSDSPENIPMEKEQELPPRVDSTNVPDVIIESKDVDLRVLPTAVPEVKPAPVVQKRASIDALENKAKKAKHDKFDILFGNEDVDLRQLPPKVDELCPPPPSITDSPKTDANAKAEESENITVPSPRISPKERDWTEVKAKSDESKKTPTKLDLVRAKLAEATKGKDRMNKSFYNKQNGDKERRRTISSEDMDLRAETLEDFNPADHKKTISIIMSQAKQQLNDGQLDKNQYETLMFQVMQINEQLKLKEAKQKESFEMSKLKLKAHIEEENNKVATPKSSPKEQNRFGDIDERVVPSIGIDTSPDNMNMIQDSDMRMNTVITHDSIEGPKFKGLLPRPPMMTVYMPPYGPAPMWRGQPRPRHDEYLPRRMRGPAPPFFRGKFDSRIPRPPFDARMPMFPAPKMGICQGENPLKPYERLTTPPPPLGAPGFMIPPTDFKLLEYIDQDPVKTIQIDGILREIRFYGEIAVIMLDWDDPREIKFLPGSRRITFDNKDSVVLSFNEPYKQVEIDDQVFDIKFGAPTRELYINGKWYECLFGAQPMGIIIEGKPHLIHLEGPLPQVDIGKTKRTDLIAGKINMIVDGVHMCPLFLDAKVQKININGNFLTIRFVDAFTTVLINETPFRVKFGDLPKPIYFGNEKHFIRFSDVPRHVSPGSVQIIGMEGSGLPIAPAPALPLDNSSTNTELDHSPLQRPSKTPSPESESQGLDILASLMPTGMAPATGSQYFLAEPLFSKPDKIPGLETPSEERAAAGPAVSRDINVNDLFAQLVATGIVKAPELKTENADEETKVMKNKDDKNVHTVDLLKPETLRTKQPGLVTRLYGGMQCSGCGARFAPEHTVRYSQHLDWHFRQNRRERDSARRAHSRRWHYDTADWLRYEELEDLDEREKSWFESGTAEGEGEPHEAAEVPSVAAGAPADRQCALCGDTFDQFFNEDLEEWHLRNSVRHDDQNYHPMCYEDYKASLAKEERKSPLDNSTDEVVAIEKEVEPIEIKDVDETVDQSDNESVVEVVEPEGNEPVEIDEGDEDDVVLKAEPVEQVVVDDEADTDDETSAARAERDRAAEIDFSNVKIKQEPLDPDDEPIITAEEEAIHAGADTTRVTVQSSIDGNVQLEATPAQAAIIPLGGIRINITKSLPTLMRSPPQDDGHQIEDSSTDEPLPPGEEPELEYKVKPNLKDVHFSRQPPVRKGNELSGLCSIM